MPTRTNTAWTLFLAGMSGSINEEYVKTWGIACFLKQGGDGTLWAPSRVPRWGHFISNFFLVRENQDHDFCRFLFGLLAAINTVLKDKWTEQESSFKKEYYKLGGCHPLVAVEVKDGRNSLDSVNLHLSAPSPTIQLRSVWIQGFSMPLGIGGSAVSALCCHPKVTESMHPQFMSPPREPLSAVRHVICACSRLLMTWGKEAAKLLWMCIFSCPWAASSGQLTSLCNTGMDGIEEKMLVCPEFKHSPLHSLKNTEESSCFMKFRQ